MIIYLLSGLLSISLLVLHLLGNGGLYFRYDWYDIMMHILGGTTLGLLGYQVSVSMNRIEHLSWKKIVLAVFMIGLAWEIFEAMFGIAGAPVGTKAYYVDTIKDLFDDCLGALFAFYIASLLSKIIHRKPAEEKIRY